jgi:hypothetical protein
MNIKPRTAWALSPVCIAVAAIAGACAPELDAGEDEVALSRDGSEVLIQHWSDREEPLWPGGIESAVSARLEDERGDVSLWGFDPAGAGLLFVYVAAADEARGMSEVVAGERSALGLSLPGADAGKIVPIIPIGPPGFPPDPIHVEAVGGFAGQVFEASLRLDDMLRR